MKNLENKYNVKIQDIDKLSEAVDKEAINILETELAKRKDVSGLHIVFEPKGVGSASFTYDTETLEPYIFVKPKLTKTYAKDFSHELNHMEHFKKCPQYFKTKDSYLPYDIPEYVKFDNATKTFVKCNANEEHAIALKSILDENVKGTYRGINITDADFYFNNKPKNHIILEIVAEGKEQVASKPYLKGIIEALQKPNKNEFMDGLLRYNFGEHFLGQYKLSSCSTNRQLWNINENITYDEFINALINVCV